MSSADPIKTIESILRTLHRAKITVEEFTEDSQPVLNGYLNTLVTELETLQQSQNAATSLMVPAEVLQLVDEGKNPDAFTERRIDEASMRLQATKGKVAAFAHFKQQLLKQIDVHRELWGAQIDEYRALTSSEPTR